MIKPTEQTYNELQTAYDYFNKTLFADQLPPCLITMQRKNRTRGYFSGNRWNSSQDESQLTDEIALNPAHFANRTTDEVLSTLVHEMVHLWQHHFGTPSRTGYHNKEWAKKMTDVGLIPSNTGQEGGKQTGQQMTHYIAPAGAYANASAKLLQKGFVIPWLDRAVDSPERKKKANTRSKYSCPSCGINAWAKPDAHFICGDCNQLLEVVS